MVTLIINDLIGVGCVGLQPWCKNFRFLAAVLGGSKKRLQCNLKISAYICVRAYVYFSPYIHVYIYIYILVTRDIYIYILP